MLSLSQVQEKKRKLLNVLTALTWENKSACYSEGICFTLRNITHSPHTKDDITFLRKRCLVKLTKKSTLTHVPESFSELLCRAAFKHMLVHTSPPRETRSSSLPFPQHVQSFWVVARASGIPAIPHSFLSFTNLMRVCPVPPSRSLTKMLIGAGHSTDSWGTALVTCLQLDFCHSPQLPGPCHSPSPSVSIYPTLTSLAGLLQVALTALLKPNEAEYTALLHQTSHLIIESHQSS